jgi:hypothetical protein
LKLLLINLDHKLEALTFPDTGVQLGEEGGASLKYNKPWD